MEAETQAEAEAGRSRSKWMQKHGTAGDLK